MLLAALIEFIISMVLIMFCVSIMLWVAAFWGVPIILVIVPLLRLQLDRIVPNLALVASVAGSRRSHDDKCKFAYTASLGAL